MKNYNKLPFKERKRHLEYQYNQTERQERILTEREMKRLEQEKFDAFYNEEKYKTEKDREAEEAYSLIQTMMKRGAQE